jgi:hypothetical protein
MRQAATTTATLLLVLVVAVSCSGGGTPTASPTTTATTTSAPTTTSQPPAPNATGTGDAGVETRLYDVLTAEYTLFVDSQAFTANLATLTSVEPSITYGAGLRAPTDPNTVNIAVSSDGQWACLTARSDVGHVFVVGLGNNPGASTYIGITALTTCSAATVQAMKPNNG